MSVNIFRNWIKNLGRQLLAGGSQRLRRLRPHAASGQAASTRQPRLEVLEERVTPTNYVVSLATPDSASTPGTLRYAITEATSGTDTITFASSLSGDTITLTSGLTLSHSVTITGLGAANLKISGNNTARVFLVNTEVAATIASLTIENGYAGSGGGIWNKGLLTLSNDTFTGNTATSSAGGGVLNTGTLTVSNSTFTSNTAVAGGGLANYGSQGTATVASSTFNGNSATNTAGGVDNYEGTLTLSNSTVFNNSAGNSGGGVHNAGTLTLTNDTITGNTATSVEGGGIRTGNTSTLTLLNTIVAGNTAIGGHPGPDIDGTIAVADNYLIGTTTGYTITSSAGNKFTGTSGLATTLASNGGPTQTVALTASSPAISTGGAVTAVVANPQGNGIGATDTTIYVQNDAAIAVTSGSYTILIGQEEMLVTAVNLTTNALTVQRGVNGTTATSHAIGVSIYLATDQRGVTRPTPSDMGSYQAPATITSSSAALAISATSLTLTGSGFDTIPANDVVTFDNGVTGTVTAAGATTLTVALTGLSTVSAGTALHASVTVDGASSGTAIEVGVVSPVLTVNTTTLADNSTSITLTGAGFSTASANDIVSFNLGVAGTVTAATSTQLTVAITTPPTSLGALSATVTSNGATAGASQVATEVAGDWIVTNPAGSGGSLTSVTLRYAVANSLSGDQITFTSSLTGSTITLSSALALGHNLTITGLGAANLAISGNLATEVFSVSAGVTASIASLTVKNGKITGSGGGILNDGVLTLSNITLTGNSASASGGGIVNASAATLTLSNDTISGNTASATGSDIDNASGATILAGTSALTSASNVNDSGTLDLKGNGISVGILGGSGTVIDSGAAATLTVSGGGSFSGSINGANTTLAGTGTVGALTVSGGTVNPGSPISGVGTLSAGSANFSSTGHVAVDITGSSGAVTTDLLHVTSGLTLGGTSALTINLNGLTTTSSALTIITDGSQTGQFSTVTVTNNPNGYQAIVAYTSTAVTVTIGPSVTASVSNLPANAPQLTVTGSAFDTNIAHDIVSFDNGVTGTVTAATSTSLTVGLTGLTSATGGTALHALVTVDGVSNGSSVQVATVAPVVTANSATLSAAAANVTINGYGFDTNTAHDIVTFDNGVTGLVTTAASSSLTVSVTGLGNVTANTAVHASVTVDGVSNGGLVQLATIAPAITSSTANLSTAATSLALAGFGFDPTAAHDVVTLDNGVTASVISASSTTLNLNLTGVSSVTPGMILHATVTVDGITSGNPVSVATVVSGAPVSPIVIVSTANLADTATSVTISGSSFSTTLANDSVAFNLGVAGTVTAATASSLTVTLTTPPTALGALTAVVTANSVSSGAAVQVATEIIGDWVVTDAGSSAGSLTDVTLPYAVGHALNGDQITFASSLSGDTITLGSALTPGNSITITGLGAGNLTISGNHAVEVFNIASTVTASIASLTVENGHAAMGGGIDNHGTLTLANVAISGNSASTGGGIFNSGTLTLNNATLSGNTASKSGGGIVNTGTLTVTNLTLSGNSAKQGGAIFSGGTATLTNTTLAGNSASYGGGIADYGTMTLSGATLANNSATTDGGGIYGANDLLTLDNVTVFANSAANGGGILDTTDSLTLSNDTIAANSASAGGGVYIYDSTTVMLNTIIANNTAGTGPDVYGTVLLANNDLVDNTAGLIIGVGTGDRLGVSSGLASSLASNGGPTQTLALLPGSAALSTGGALTNIVTGHAVGMSDTTIYVGDAATISQTSGSYTILIGQEEMLVTSVNTTTDTLTVQRGVNGTTATTHAVGAGVYLVTDQRGVIRPTPPDIGAYQLGPAVTASSANLAPSATALTIAGSGFDITTTNDSVTLDHGVTGTVTSASGLSLTVSITGLSGLAMGTALHASVTVDGVSSGSLVQVATVLPVITANTTTLADTGTTITINGASFSATSTNDSVSFNLGMVGSITSATATQLTVTITTPPTALGNLTAVATVNGVSTGAAVQVATEVASDWIVTDASDNPGSLTDITLPYAAGHALNGDQITFASSLSGDTITLDNVLTLANNVTITGLGAGNLAITGDNTSLFFIAAAATVNISDVTVKGGFSFTTGGGIVNDGTLSLTNDIITGNTAEGTGGGVFNEGVLTLSNDNVYDNSAAYGAGVANRQGTVTVTNSSISYNTAQSSAGGIQNLNGSLALTNCTITDNKGGKYGGGIVSVGTLTLTSDTISGNSATYGAGIYGNGSLTLSYDALTSNSGVYGGAVVDYGTLTLSNSLVSANSASQGGGIYADGTLTLSNVTLSGNSATYGGAIIDDGTALTLVNTTLFGNSALYGGGLYQQNGTLTLSNVTVASNYASALGAGGGIYQDGGTTTLLNTIVAGNSASSGPDIYGTIAVADDSLVGLITNMTISSGTGNYLGVSAGLASTLASNGGPTPTVALLPGSAALSTGGSLTNIAAGHAVGMSDTTIYVQNAAAIAVTPGNTIILIDQEEMLVTNVDTTTNTLTVQRGTNGTTATTHAVSAGVYLATDQRGAIRPTPPDIGAFQLLPTVTASTASWYGSQTTVTITGTGFDTTTANDSLTFDHGVTGIVTAASNTSLTVSITGLSNVATDTALHASVTVDGISSGNAVQVATLYASFGVANVAATPSGVVLTFNGPIDPSTTVLYSSPGEPTAADITLMGTTTGPVRGSLVIDPTNPDMATFVQTSGLLAADTYTLTVTDAVKAVGSFTMSGNYSTTVTVASTTEPVLSVPSFARGPGQPVMLADSVGNDTGIPISLNDAFNVTQASFTLTYDPTLLTIANSRALTLSSLATTSGLDTVSYTITSVDSHHSELSVSLTSSDGGRGLTATSLTPLVTITASVPATAPYLNKALLNLGNVVVDGTSAVGVSGVDENAYLGNVTGSGELGALDSSLADQVGAGSGTGFSAFKDLDPNIIGAVGDSSVSALDASLINQVGAGDTIAQIPSVPNGIPLTTGGPDPYLYLSAVQGSAGQTVTETLYLDVTDPQGIQLSALDEAIGFDPSVVQISDVRSAAGLAGLGAYGIASTTDNGTGVLLVGQAFGGSGLPPVVPYGTDIAILQFDVTLNANAAVGSETGLTLLQNGTINNQTKYTAISDNEGALTWTPGMAPSNSGNPAVDGTVTVVPVAAPVVPAAVTPVTETPRVVLPKVIVPVKRVVPIASTPVSQPVQVPPATSAGLVSPYSEAATATGETVDPGVSLMISTLAAPVQPETFVTAAPVLVSPTIGADMGTAGTTTGKSPDPGAALSLAALATNKMVLVASTGTSNVKTPTSALDEMYRQLGMIAAAQVNGNLGATGAETTEDWSDVWELEFFLAVQEQD